MVAASLSDPPPPTSEVAALLQDRDQRLFFEILFEESQEPSWDEAQSCLEALQKRQFERDLAEVQRAIEANPAGPELRGLLGKKQDLMRRLASGN
ncbi:MAG: hypothetical protein PVS2B2_18980 [Candidatus Acidiferrum sp.]